VSTLRALAVVAFIVVCSCAGSTAPVVTDTPTSSLSSRTSAPVATATPVPALSMTGKVTMGDNFFAPDDITVAVGATVVWEIISGDARHDVVASDGSFRSNSPMNRGDTFSYTFTQAGEYAYICSFHTLEHMVGKVVVR
jgi:plastocyanin